MMFPNRWSRYDLIGKTASRRRTLFQRHTKNTHHPHTSHAPHSSNNKVHRSQYSVQNVPRFFYMALFIIFFVTVFFTTETSLYLLFFNHHDPHSHDGSSSSSITHHHHLNPHISHNTSIHEKLDAKDEINDQDKHLIHQLQPPIAQNHEHKHEYVRKGDNHNNHHQDLNNILHDNAAKAIIKSVNQINPETDTNNNNNNNNNNEPLTNNLDRNSSPNLHEIIQPNEKNALSPFAKDSECLRSISDLTHAERYPTKGERHMVQPPSDTTITLVCCETTAGSMSIAVHFNWAPLGAKRFLDMVTSDYFSSRVPLMRCVHNFICQFGIAGIPSLNKNFKSIQDDRNWLPEGPAHRTNESGKKRYTKGYMAFAGGGKNSRSNQLIVALNDNQFLGGGSPWEVPWGEVVGKESFQTLDSIYTGYGEKGPSQGLLHRKGASETVRKDFPNLDYMTSCHIVEEIQSTD